MLTDLMSFKTLVILPFSVFLLPTINVQKGAARRSPRPAYALGGGVPPRLRGLAEDRRGREEGGPPARPGGGEQRGGDRDWGRRAARRRQGPEPASSAEAEGRRTAQPVTICESCGEQE